MSAPAMLNFAPFHPTAPASSPADAGSSLPPSAASRQPSLHDILNADIPHQNTLPLGNPSQPPQLSHPAPLPEASHTQSPTAQSNSRNISLSNTLTSSHTSRNSSTSTILRSIVNSTAASPSFNVTSNRAGVSGGHDSGFGPGSGSGSGSRSGSSSGGVGGNGGGGNRNSSYNDGIGGVGGSGGSGGAQREAGGDTYAIQSCGESLLTYFSNSGDIPVLTADDIAQLSEDLRNKGRTRKRIFYRNENLYRGVTNWLRHRLELPSSSNLNHDPLYDFVKCALLNTRERSQSVQRAETSRARARARQSKVLTSLQAGRVPDVSPVIVSWSEATLLAKLTVAAFFVQVLDCTKNDISQDGPHGEGALAMLNAINACVQNPLVFERPLDKFTMSRVVFRHLFVGIVCRACNQEISLCNADVADMCAIAVRNFLCTGELRYLQDFLGLYSKLYAGKSERPLSARYLPRDEPPITSIPVWSHWLQTIDDTELIHHIGIVPRSMITAVTKGVFWTGIANNIIHSQYETVYLALQALSTAREAAVNHVKQEYGASLDEHDSDYIQQRIAFYIRNQLSTQPVSSTTSTMTQQLQYQHQDQQSVIELSDDGEDVESFVSASPSQPSITQLWLISATPESAANMLASSTRRSSVIAPPISYAGGRDSAQSPFTTPTINLAQLQLRHLPILPQSPLSARNSSFTTPSKAPGSALDTSITITPIALPRAPSLAISATAAVDAPPVKTLDESSVRKPIATDPTPTANTRRAHHCKSCNKLVTGHYSKTCPNRVANANGHANNNSATANSTSGRNKRCSTAAFNEADSVDTMPPGVSKRTK
ncbi:hypothetical protein GQ42DRAFT_178180 [Ramicandelaber brevisporus]|nr:hypothetical protein GQ42DRAFT_178180 [Ramicandelaber brevisporus]